MPILYMYEKLIKDEKGALLTPLYRCQQFLRRQIYHAQRGCRQAGKRIISRIHERVPPFHEYCIEGETFRNFPYYYKKIDTFYDIVVKASDNGEYMHVFCVDSTELHHTQIQLRSTNRKLSMALDVANIVPWKWNLRTHTILCDVNKPIELSNNAGAMDDEQLSVPDSQYFSKIHKEDLEK